MAQEQAIPMAADVGEESLNVAGPWLLMWWRFRKHRVAMISVAIIVVFYIVALFADFLSGGNPEITDERYNYVPPQTIHWFDDGGLHPYMYDITSELDLNTFKKQYDVDTEVKSTLR